LNKQPSKELPSKEELLKEIMLTNELVWNGRIGKDDINDWLTNFKGEVFDKDYEESLALWLLTNFVFYNEHEVKHLCRTVYRQYLHWRLLREEDDNIDDLLNILNENTMFTSLGKVGESGAMILYAFRTTNDIGKRDIVAVSGKARSGTKHIVYIDDVTLSDDEDSQAWMYLEDEVGKYPDSEIHLITLLASDKAIDFLADKGIKVINAITLTDHNKAFNVDSDIFILNCDHRDNAKKFAEYYGAKCHPEDPLGHSNGQYLFGFHYNVPDNSLPIIWSKKDGWRPIFERFHKNYGKTRLSDLGHFI